MLLHVKSKDLKEINLYYFIEVQGLQVTRKDLKRLTYVDVSIEYGSNNDQELMEVAQIFVAIKSLNFLYLLKCMFQTPPC